MKWTPTDKKVGNQDVLLCAGFLLLVLVFQYNFGCDYPLPILYQWLVISVYFLPLIAGMDLYSSCLWHLQKEVELDVLAHALYRSNKLLPQGLCAMASLKNLQKDHNEAIHFLTQATQVRGWNVVGGRGFLSWRDYHKLVTFKNFLWNSHKQNNFINTCHLDSCSVEVKDFGLGLKQLSFFLLFIFFHGSVLFRCCYRMAEAEAGKFGRGNYITFLSCLTTFFFFFFFFFFFSRL